MIFVYFTNLKLLYSFSHYTSLKFIFSSIFSNSEATSWSDIWSIFQLSSSTSLKSPTEQGRCKVPGGYRPFTLPGKPPTILSICKKECSIQYISIYNIQKRFSKSFQIIHWKIILSMWGKLKTKLPCLIYQTVINTNSYANYWSIIIHDCLHVADR